MNQKSSQAKARIWSVDKIIETHGKDPDMFDEIVSQVRSFKDLCVLGKAFIENRVCRHINYYGEFGKSEDSNGHSCETNNLSTLHDRGVLTTGGQCNLKLPDEEQRGYLEFYCEPRVANKIRERLFNDPRIYTVDFGTITGRDRRSLECESEKQPVHNFFCNAKCDWKESGNIVEHVQKCEYIGCLLNLTRYIPTESIDWNYCTNLHVDTHPREMIWPEYPNITEILYDKPFFSIVCRDYGAPKNCSDILLELMSNIHGL